MHHAISSSAKHSRQRSRDEMSESRKTRANKPDDAISRAAIAKVIFASHPGLVKKCSAPAHR
jgi:hypothetical protein